MEMPSFNNYKDTIVEAKLKAGHVTLTTLLLRVICHHRLGFDAVYMHAKFDDSSFSRSRNITGGVKT